jgi:hypothetical protein
MLFSHFAGACKGDSPASILPSHGEDPGSKLERFAKGGG